ncbi:cyclic nucleotide-binding domain-containing protein [Aestuariivirga sp.]|uniref:cyclic nucleotide-binding domain-containing protein n=1 Tax=Aestuariivirga sp. TaxID=2650926 RepID=UPI003BACA794
MTGFEWGDLFHRENIVHVGALFYLAAFLFRDTLVLRALVIAGDIVYMLYFFFAPATPLWGGIFWSSLFILVNLWMIGQIIAERVNFDLTATQKHLFDVLQDLSPGQFRSLLRIAEEGRATAPVVITQEGQPLDRLYFVVDGEMDIQKAGRHARTKAETFIGEIAFLLQRTATATVTLEPGCSYFVWNAAMLKKLLAAKPELNTALIAAMNRHLANKVATAVISLESIVQDPARV